MYSTIFNIEEMIELRKLLKMAPPFSIKNNDGKQKGGLQTQYTNLKDFLQSKEIKNMKNYLDSYIDLLNEKSEQIRYLNDCRKIYENLCRQRAREIIQSYNYVDNNIVMNKIKDWAFSKKEYIHKTTNCYIDYVLWRENISELQIRIVNRRHKDLDKIKHVDNSFCFEESGNTYTVIKKNCNEKESDLAQFIVLQLQTILTEVK